MIAIREPVDPDAHAWLCELHRRVESARWTRDNVSDVAKPHIQLRLTIEDIDFLLHLVRERDEVAHG